MFSKEELETAKERSLLKWNLILNKIHLLDFEEIEEIDGDISESIFELCGYCKLFEREREKDTHPYNIKSCLVDCPMKSKDICGVKGSLLHQLSDLMNEYFSSGIYDMLELVRRITEIITEINTM